MCNVFYFPIPHHTHKFKLHQNFWNLAKMFSFALAYKNIYTQLYLKVDKRTVSVISTQYWFIIDYRLNNTEQCFIQISNVSLQLLMAYLWIRCVKAGGSHVSHPYSPISRYSSTRPWAFIGCRFQSLSHWGSCSFPSTLFCSPTRLIFLRDHQFCNSLKKQNTVYKWQMNKWTCNT